MWTNWNDINCDRCQFRANTSVLWGGFYYLLGDGTSISIPRHLGWCHACRTIQPVEDLDLNGRLARLNLLEEELASLKEQFQMSLASRKRVHLAVAVPVLAGVSAESSAGPRETAESKAGDLNHAEYGRLLLDQKHLLQQMLFLRSRRAPARCLACGSTDIVDLESEPSATPDVYPRRLGLKHPQCGGNLWFKPIKERFEISHAMRYYTPEGDLIRVERQCPEDADSD